MFLTKRGSGMGGGGILKGLFGGNVGSPGRNGDGLGNNLDSLGEKSWFLHEGLCGVLFRLHNIYCLQLELQQKKQGIEAS